jgi:hypothetical protein
MTLVWNVSKKVSGIGIVGFQTLLGTVPDQSAR